ncbi:MAG: hypothetical protein OEY14_15975 [Myxococcales bacterium]|nr:hypothetical protein [Myxococcales bacterium]
MASNRRRNTRDPRSDRRAEPSEANTLRRRAFRHARKGEYRKAAVAMRRVVALEQEARAWVALGKLLDDASKPKEALDALRQGLYLHRREGAHGRAQTVARMILAIDPHDGFANQLR